MQISFATLNYQDITKEHWAYGAVQNLVKRGIIKDNTYKFNGADPITRYEFAYSLSQALNQMDAGKVNRSDLKVMEVLVTEFSQELNKIGFDTDAFNKKIDNINETIELLKKRVDENEAKIEKLMQRLDKVERQI